MTIGEKKLHIEGMIWLCSSIFYSRKNSATLLNAIARFCEINKDRLKHWSLYFSQAQGERIDMVFIPQEQEADTVVKLVEEYFGRFLEENPSENLHSIPYGSAIWMPYPNNSSAWNAFNIPTFLFDGEDVRDFAQCTSLLITGLYDEESSFEENITTIATFLRVQIAKKQNVSFPEIADQEIAETIRSYWDYEENELLAEWLQYVDIASAPVIVQRHLDYWVQEPFGFLHGKS